MKTWPICPWHKLPANQCPDSANETYPFSPEGAVDHISWHCHVMTDEGVLERVIDHDKGGTQSYRLPK